MSTTPGLFVVVEDVFARWRAYRETVRTRRIVSNLPRHIRKDIGWPESAPDRHAPRWL